MKIAILVDATTPWLKERAQRGPVCVVDAPASRAAVAVYAESGWDDPTRRRAGGSFVAGPIAASPDVALAPRLARAAVGTAAPASAFVRDDRTAPTAWVRSAGNAEFGSLPRGTQLCVSDKPLPCGCRTLDAGCRERRACECDHGAGGAQLACKHTARTPARHRAESSRRSRGRADAAQALGVHPERGRAARVRWTTDRPWLGCATAWRLAAEERPPGSAALGSV